MTSQATYETQVMPDGTWVEGNWSHYPGSPPKFNVYRKGGFSLSDLGIGSNSNFNQVPLDYGQEKAQELLGRYKDMLLTSSEPNWEFDDDPEGMGPAVNKAIFRQIMRSNDPLYDLRRRRGLQEAIRKSHLIKGV